MVVGAGVNECLRVHGGWYGEGGVRLCPGEAPDSGPQAINEIAPRASDKRVGKCGKISG